MSILTNDEAYDDLNYLVATVKTVGALSATNDFTIITDPYNRGTANYTEQENLWVRCVETGVETILVPSGGIVQDKTNCKLPHPPIGTVWTYKVYVYSEKINEVKNTDLYLHITGSISMITLNKAFKFRIGRTDNLISYNNVPFNFKVEEYDVTSLIWDMEDMFSEQQIEHTIDNFSMASCTTAYAMFKNVYFGTDYPALDTSNVRTMRQYMIHAKGKGIATIHNIDTSSATDTNHMFYNSEIEVFDFVFKRTPGVVTDTQGMFEHMPKITCMRGMDPTNTPGLSNDMFGDGTAERLVANGIPSYAMPNMADGHGWERTGSCSHKTRIMHGSLAIRKLKFGTVEPRFMFLNGIMLYPTTVTVDNDFITIDTDRIDMSNV